MNYTLSKSNLIKTFTLIVTIITLAMASSIHTHTTGAQGTAVNKGYVTESSGGYSGQNPLVVQIFNLDNGQLINNLVIPNAPVSVADAYPSHLKAVGNKIFIARPGDKQVNKEVIMINANNDTLDKIFVTNGQPIDLAEFNGKLYILNRNSSFDIQEIDPFKGKFTKSIFYGDRPDQPVFIEVMENKIYLTASSYIEILDLNTGNYLSTINFTDSTGSITKVDEHKLYVAHINSVSVIDTLLDQVVGVFSINGSPREFVVSNSKVYAPLTNGQVGIIDLNTDSLIGYLPLVSIDIAAYSNKIYSVRGPVPSLVDVINTLTDNLETTISLEPTLGSGLIEVFQRQGGN